MKKEEGVVAGWLAGCPAASRHTSGLAWAMI
jgi:hypothetical protein